MQKITNKSTVLIAGGGPVGMGLAIELGQRDIHCTVIERNTGPSPVPKGQNLTQRTMEHFICWGAEKKLREARTVSPDFGIGGLTTYGTLISDYSYDWLQREVVRPYYFTDNERLPQYATEKVLRERVAELPNVETFYGWALTDLQQNQQSVVATGINKKSQLEQQFCADYLVGCDGSHSTARELSGITQTGSDHEKRMVLLVFKSTGLHELLKCYPGKFFYNVLNPELKGYWRFFGRVDLDGTWFFHAPVPAGTTRDNFDFNAYLVETVGASFEVDIEYIGFWDLRISTADSYRNGRVFIAGDAAHSHPPYGAYGINTGFEDARNLGWKLASVEQGWANEKILDTYEEERRPVFISTATDFIESVIQQDAEFLDAYNPETDKAAFEAAWQQRAAGTDGEVNSFEPNYRGSSLIHGPVGATCNARGPHAFAARAGHHLAPFVLTDGENVYSLLGAEYTLLAFDADETLVERMRNTASEHAIPLKIVSESNADASEHYQSTLVLVRPDHFVAWTISECEYHDDVLLLSVGEFKQQENK